jgi:hypothetical protein
MTTTHPFYVTGKGWVAAGDLIVGDEVYTLDGDTGTVTVLKPEKLNKPISVYNLEVKDFHSYFVGNGVLVHNKYATNQEMNKMKLKVLNGEDLTFDTANDTVQFIKKKFPDFIEEVAESRSSEGWHFDIHEIKGLEGLIEHINLYSKKYEFRIHILWKN